MSAARAVWIAVALVFALGFAVMSYVAWALA
jgi:hypothetical protein